MKRTLLLLPAVALVACDKKNEFVAPPPPPVTVANPDPKEVTTYRESPATFSGITEIDIRARVRGFLEDPSEMDGLTPSEFEGKKIDEGKLLFLIEQEPFEAAVAIAKANLENAEAALQLATDRLSRLKRANESASGAVSEIDVRIGESEVKQAAAVVSQAESELENKQVELSYTTVMAPITGRVSKSYVDIGNLVDGSQATLLATITDDSRMQASFEVPEREMIKFLQARANPEGIKLDELADVRLTLSDGTIYEHPGRLDYIDTRVDPRTRTATVRAVFPNPDGKIASGMFGLVGYPETFPNKQFPNSVLVPAASVLRDLAGNYVWVVDEENIVRRRGVETGVTVQHAATDPNELPQRDMIVLKGLTPEDRVVVAGLQRAREGAPVDPKMAGEEGAKPEVPAGAPQPDPEN